MAVGASAAAIVRMVIATGIRLGAIGVVVGLGAGGLAARMLESRFTAFGTADARVFTAAAAALLAVAVLAAWIPARRAARVDPLAALRADG
jgi:ABC-type antimicrobial peptide transport system permease subunit